MSKKTDHEREKEEEKDLEEEEEGEEEGEEHAGDHEDDDEDEDEEASVAPAKAAAARGSRPRARREQHDDHDDHGRGHGHDEDEDSAEDDPTWWTPHAVMSALVLIGVLGFFGVFNKLLGPLVGKPVQAAEEHAAAASAPAHTPPAAAAPQTYGAKHLLVAYKGAMRAAPTITRTEDEAKARATEAQKKAKSGAKFEDLVKEYSDEPGAGARGGDLGKFRKGQMVPEFQNAVEKLKVGQVSDLVKTAFGYHVILRTE